MKPDWEYSWEEDADEAGPKASPRSRATHRPHVWSGPLGVATRLACVTGALVSITIAVLANTDLAARLDGSDQRPPATRTAAVAPPETPVPGPAVSVAPSPLRPMQGPVLPRAMSLAPADLCRIIKLDGRSSPWERSPVYPDEWECLSTQGRKEAAASGKKAAQPTLRIFAMARGTGEADVRYVRFKISASDAAMADEGAELASERLSLLFTSIGWSLPERAALSSRLRQPFSLTQDGTTIRFVEEKMSAWSYNLIVTFPKMPAIAKAARAQGAEEDAAGDKAKIAEAGPASN